MDKYNRFFIRTVIGILPLSIMQMLNTENDVVNLSLDSLLKNRLHHPEIDIDEYKKIEKLLLNPDKVSLSKRDDLSVLVFNYENKNYLMVIKTTENKKENYLTSFRYFSENEFLKY